MKVHLGVVGRLKESYLVEAEEEYRKRLRPFCTLTVHEAKDEAGLLAALPANAHLYAFDERGAAITSAQFSAIVTESGAKFVGTCLYASFGSAEICSCSVVRPPSIASSGIGNESFRGPCPSHGTMPPWPTT